MSQPLRIVLDTNVVISALVFPKGRLTPLRSGWRNAQFLPLVTLDTVAELGRVLQYPKFRLSSQEQHELLTDFLPYSETVTIPDKPPRTPTCRDPFDIPFLQLAIVGKSDYLVSGDEDVLSLAGQMPCPVVTPDRFLEILAPS